MTSFAAINPRCVGALQLAAGRTRFEIMQLKRLSDEVTTTGQVQPTDLAAVKAAGFRSILCNRPDGEGPGQPSFAEIEAAAAGLGLAARHQPVRPGALSEVDAMRFRALVAELPKPILAFCGSGARSTGLWRLAQSLLS
jgi:sulfide:quinone oxidoreductase